MAAMTGSVKAGQRSKGDAALKEAEKCLKAPKGFFEKMMWKPDRIKAASKFAEAGNAFASGGAKDLAVMALNRAADEYSKNNLYYQAAQHAAKGAALYETQKELWTRAAEFWTLAGEARQATDTLARGAKKLEMSNAKFASELHLLVLEAAADVNHTEEVANKAFLWIACHDNDIPKALEKYPLLIKAMGALDDDHPSRLRAQSARVLLTLMQRGVDITDDDVKKADAVFLEEINKNQKYAASDQAQTADDILSALRTKDEDALELAMQPRHLGNLDFQLAQLCKTRIRLPIPIEDDDNATTTNIEDDDHLPDLS